MMQSDWVTPDDNTDEFVICNHNCEKCILHTHVARTHTADCSLGRAAHLHAEESNRINQRRE